MKKGLDLEGLIDPAAGPKDTGVPQRGAVGCAEPPERRSDQMSIRMTPGLRAQIRALAATEGVSVAELLERAIAAYGRQS